MSVKSAIKKHWKLGAGVVCFAGAAALAPVSAGGSLALAAACGVAFGQDPKVKAAGSALGNGVRAVIDAVRGKKP